LKTLLSSQKKELPFNLDPNWTSGFISGDGSFQVDIRKNDKFKLKYQVLLRFSLSQQAREEQVLKNLIYCLDCGKVDKNINIKK